MIYAHLKNLTEDIILYSFVSLLLRDGQGSEAADWDSSIPFVHKLLSCCMTCLLWFGENFRHMQSSIRPKTFQFIKISSNFSGLSLVYIFVSNCPVLMAKLCHSRKLRKNTTCMTLLNKINGNDSLANV